MAPIMQAAEFAATHEECALTATKPQIERSIRRFQSERSKDQSSCSPADGTAKGNRTGQHARSHAELCWWLIECIPLTDTDSEVTLVCNDEGKLLNLTPNRLLWNGADYLAGPGFIAGTDGEGNLASLPPQEMNYYAKKFRAFLIAL